MAYWLQKLGRGSACRFPSRISLLCRRSFDRNSLADWDLVMWGREWLRVFCVFSSPKAEPAWLCALKDAENMHKPKLFWCEGFQYDVFWHLLPFLFWGCSVVHPAILHPLLLIQRRRPKFELVRAERDQVRYGARAADCEKGGLFLWESYSHRLSPDQGISRNYVFFVLFLFFLFHIIFQSCEIVIFILFILQSCASVILICLSRFLHVQLISSNYHVHTCSCLCILPSCTCHSASKMTRSKNRKRKYNNIPNEKLNEN